MWSRFRPMGEWRRHRQPRSQPNAVVREEDEDEDTHSGSESPFGSSGDDLPPPPARRLASVTDQAVLAEEAPARRRSPRDDALRGSAVVVDAAVTHLDSTSDGEDDLSSPRRTPPAVRAVEHEERGPQFSPQYKLNSEVRMEHSLRDRGIEPRPGDLKFSRSRVIKRRLVAAEAAEEVGDRLPQNAPVTAAPPPTSAGEDRSRRRGDVDYSREDLDSSEDIAPQPHCHDVGARRQVYATNWSTLHASPPGSPRDRRAASSDTAASAAADTTSAEKIRGLSESPW